MHDAERTNKLYIDLEAIAENYKIIKKFVGNNTECTANIKYNAYGLGVIPIMRALSGAGCNKFFVTSLEEAIEIRDSLSITDNIYVLKGISAGQEPMFTKYQITPVLNNKTQFEIFNNFCLKKNHNFPAALNVDTGINRFGFSVEEALSLTKEGFFKQKVKLIFLMSQLAFGVKDTEKPLNALRELHNLLNIPVSLADSNYICLGKDYHFDIIRLGIILYGCAPKEMGLKNAISLYSNIVQIKETKEQIYIGHDNKYQVERGRMIASIPIGYAHGLHRSLKENTCFYINNRPAPIIGEISMDFTIIDVTNIPKYDLFIGAEVEILGQNNDLTKMAEQAGTTRHDILISLSRLKRIYI